MNNPASLSALATCLLLAGCISQPKPPADILERGIVAWNYQDVTSESPVSSERTAVSLSVQDLESETPAIVDRTSLSLLALVPLVGLFLPPAGENTNSIHFDSMNPNVGLGANEIELILVDELGRAGLFSETSFMHSEADYVLSGEINIRRRVYAHTSGLGILIAGLLPMLIAPLGTNIDQLDAKIRIHSARTGVEVFSQSFSLETRDYVRIHEADIELRNYGESLVPQFVSQLISAISKAEFEPEPVECSGRRITTP